MVFGGHQAAQAAAKSGASVTCGYHAYAVRTTLNSNPVASHRHEHLKGNVLNRFTYNVPGIYHSKHTFGLNSINAWTLTAPQITSGSVTCS